MQPDPHAGPVRGILDLERQDAGAAAGNARLRRSQAEDARFDTAPAVFVVVIVALARFAFATVDGDAINIDVADERRARARFAGEKNGGDAYHGHDGREPTHRHGSPSRHSHGTSPASHPRQHTARCLLNSD